MRKYIVPAYTILFIIAGSLLSSCGIFGPDEVTDHDGNTYRTADIGDQTWMAENLKTTTYSDGTAIPLVNDNTAWSNLDTPAYCWYDNDENTYGDSYGALYNWFTVNTGKLCPKGWHVPTDTDWTTLVDFLGGEEEAGYKLKEAGALHWPPPNLEATNESGFTAIPVGYRYPEGPFIDQNNNSRWCHWWSSTEHGFTNWALYRHMSSNHHEINSYGFSMNSGFSVRCIKD